MYGLRAYNHEIYLERINKIGLNPFDNKRWILLNGIQTLPYGHWKITLFNNLVKSGLSEEEAEQRIKMARLKNN